MTMKSAEKSQLSQALSSIQYICFRKALGSNMGAPNLFLDPGVIYPRWRHLSSLRPCLACKSNQCESVQCCTEQRRSICQSAMKLFQLTYGFRGSFRPTESATC